MKLIEEVIDLTLSKSGNNWYKVEDFKEFLAVDELLNLKKVRVSLKALTTLKLL